MARPRLPTDVAVETGGSEKGTAYENGAKETRDPRNLVNEPISTLSSQRISFATGGFNP